MNFDCCHIMKQHQIPDSNSGIRISNDQANQYDDLVIKDKRVINVCLTCPLSECEAEKRDKKRLARQTK